MRKVLDLKRHTFNKHFQEGETVLNSTGDLLVSLTTDRISKQRNLKKVSGTMCRFFIWTKTGKLPGVNFYRNFN